MQLCLGGGTNQRPRIAAVVPVQLQMSVPSAYGAHAYFPAIYARRILLAENAQDGYLRAAGEPKRRGFSETIRNSEELLNMAGAMEEPPPFPLHKMQ
ncbi:hypothetical protein EVAR_24074_1 [Eumeta japonica]|uniref:Uncharacterized protein n=1 Tax=Eumeta variegata TaxID=151549 RepID=A0A4C2A7F6_EUMVA|nr:hypothetical protein EVAR_24074_1 [Eumeta japonica]